MSEKLLSEVKNVGEIVVGSGNMSEKIALGGGKYREKYCRGKPTESTSSSVEHW